MKKAKAVKKDRLQSKKADYYKMYDEQVASDVRKSAHPSHLLNNKAKYLKNIFVVIAIVYNVIAVVLIVT